LYGIDPGRCIHCNEFTFRYHSYIGCDIVYFECFDCYWSRRRSARTIGRG
jgi:hypothetical protein